MCQGLVTGTPGLVGHKAPPVPPTLLVQNLLCQVTSQVQTQMTLALIANKGKSWGVFAYSVYLCVLLALHLGLPCCLLV